MADNSKIEWTEATWNPIVGCTVVSPGCTNCYAMKMADRLEAMITAGKKTRESAKKTGIPYWAYPYGSPARGVDPESVYKAMIKEVGK